ncbi:MAG: hypothetical protein JXQ30_02950 [Spirochaetes bacterium]|nr:hypothetical protein [Spirochaetota bacterium]
MSRDIYNNLAAVEKFNLPMHNHLGNFDVGGQTCNVLVISFIEVDTAEDRSWVSDLGAIHSAYSTNSDVEVVGVFYRDGGTVSSSDMDGFGPIAFNDCYEETDDHYATMYKTAFIDLDGVGTPFTYIVSPANGFRITDKLHMAAADTGDGDGTNPDYIKLDWATITRANLQSYIL